MSNYKYWEPCGCVEGSGGWVRYVTPKHPSFYWNRTWKCNRCGLDWVQNEPEWTDPEGLYRIGQAVAIWAAMSMAWKAALDSCAPSC